jgi:outer membrane receptor protein involved in Fe transport
MQNKLLTIIALTSASTALAQERAIEEILVFGEVRETELNELPASVSVISADQLTRRSARHIEDALSLTANVNVASGSSRSRFFQIRGIGERGQFIEPLNPSVGVLIDGVDISNAATAATLFDIDQIEVFRGPQGTRYGANALAGLINIRTRGPESTSATTIPQRFSARSPGRFRRPFPVVSHGSTTRTTDSSPTNISAGTTRINATSRLSGASCGGSLPPRPPSTS